MKVRNEKRTTDRKVKDESFCTRPPLFARLRDPSGASGAPVARLLRDEGGGGRVVVRCRYDRGILGGTRRPRTGLHRADGRDRRVRFDLYRKAESVSCRRCQERHELRGGKSGTVPPRPDHASLERRFREGRKRASLFRGPRLDQVHQIRRERVHRRTVAERVPV